MRSRGPAGAALLAVLVSQPTHPMFYQDDERHHRCNVCAAPFNIPPPTRNDLMQVHRTRSAPPRRVGLSTYEYLIDSSHVYRSTR